MAAARPTHPGQAGRRQWRRRAAVAIVLALLAALAWYWAPLNAWARAGASYGARIGCSCRFVAGRSLSDCRNDLRPDMGLVMLSEDEAQESVTATFPLLARQSATYREGQGCVLEAWKD